MPELPEVEVLKRSLEPTLVGRTFSGATLTKPKMFIAPTGLSLDALIGRRVLSVGRRAKLLVVELDDELRLLIHLKLSGQLVHRLGDVTLASGGHPVPRFDAPLPHVATHGRFDFEDGSVLWFTDIRQFGRIAVLPAEALPAFFDDKRLGVEPFDDAFTPALLAAELNRHRRLAIKSTLLDQSSVVGLGNIYADEALHLSGIDPRRPSGDLNTEEVDDLHGQIRAVLNHAIEHGVADLPGYRARPDQIFPRVHGRQGLPCLTCATEIRRVVVGGRSTDFCPTCQPTGLSPSANR